MLSNRGRSDPSPPIHEPPGTQASDSRTRSARRERILTGALAGAATWFLFDQLGVPHLFGIGVDSGLIPFAALGGLLGLTRFRRVFVWSTLALVALAIVVAYTSVIVGPARGFIRVDPIPSAADAVVALSAGVTADGYLTQQGADRMLKAAELMKAGIAPVLVVTHEERRAHGIKFTAAADQKRIADLAGITQAVSIDSVKSTHDEALQVARIARARGWRHIVLVTSPFHSRRACRTFEKVGLIVSCVPSDSRDIAVHRLIFPHDRMQAFGMWLYETAGTLRYRQLGWI